MKVFVCAAHRLIQFAPIHDLDSISGVLHTVTYFLKMIRIVTFVNTLIRLSEYPTIRIYNCNFFFSGGSKWVGYNLIY